MKLVIAYIKSHKLSEVTIALHQIKGLTLGILFSRHILEHILNLILLFVKKVLDFALK